jgi:hypothetical protein
MIATMQDQPMMGMQLKIRWDVIFYRAFDRIYIFARGDASAIADTENMGIHRLRGLTPPHIQHDIRRFAANAWQGLQCRAGIWHLATIVIDQDLAKLDDIFRLIPIKPDGFDMFNQPLFAQI